MATQGSEALRRRLTEALSGVDGWLYLDEAWALHEAARCFSQPGSLTVVEIGSWKGRSTIALALGLKARGSGKVYAIDPHRGSREHIETWGKVDTFDEFRLNVASAGVADYVETLRTPSHFARAGFADGSVNILFVDGSHEYENVAQDIRDWMSALKEGATVAFNDPYMPGVYKALCELVVRADSPFRRPRSVNNTLIFQYLQNRPRTRSDTLAFMQIKMLMSLRSRSGKISAHFPQWSVYLARRMYDGLAGMSSR